ncbi:MAG: GAP family protein [Acidimicrobiales bacterium]
MIGVIGELLDSALGVAVSPVPLIALIVLLFSTNPVAKSGMFTVGWMIGVAIPLVAAVAFDVGAASGSDERGGGPLSILLGLLMLFLAWKQWSGRPKEGEPVEPPAWMAKVDQMSPLVAGGLGLFLAAVNAKNTPIDLAAGIQIAGANLSGAEATITILVYVILASVTMLVPVVASVVAADTAASLLQRLQDWLLANNNVIMTLLFGLLGLSTLGEGLSSVFG